MTARPRWCGGQCSDGSCARCRRVALAVPDSTFRRLRKLRRRKTVAEAAVSKAFELLGVLVAGALFAGFPTEPPEEEELN